MPRPIRQSLSRCGSRNSSRNSCRRRNSPRNNTPNSIRESHRSSSVANRFSLLRCESPGLPSKPLPSTMPASEVNARRTNEQTKPTVASNEKPMGFFWHGMHYITMPLHLLHLCVRGGPPISPVAPSSTANGTKTLTENSEEAVKKISSKSNSDDRPITSINRSPKKSSSTASSSGCSSASSTTPEPRRWSLENVSPTIASSTPSDVRRSSGSLRSAIPSSSSDFSSVSSSSNRRYPIPRRIVTDEDESSDDMVTAEEDFDDCSNDRWSDAIEGPPFTNMSIDFESNVDSDKLEEPMDVSMEETNFHGNERSIESSPLRVIPENAIKPTIDRRSSFSSSDDRNSVCQDYSDSSVDREITTIFRGACTSTSSDDDNHDNHDGRRNNRFVDESSNVGRSTRSGLRFREEINDAAIRKQRKIGHVGRQLNFQARDDDDSIVVSIVERINDERDVDPSKTIVTNNLEIGTTDTPDRTDSAYSDEDVDMMINESIVRLESVHTRNVRESVVEWMDQDLDYVADTEDSNDGTPLPIRARKPSIGYSSSASGDQASRQPDVCPRNPRESLTEWKEISGLDNSTIGNEIDRPADGTSSSKDRSNVSDRKDSSFDSQPIENDDERLLGNWNVLSGLDTSLIRDRNLPNDDDAISRGWKNISGIDGTMGVNGEIREEGNSTFAEAWKNISGLDSVELTNDETRRDEKIGRCLGGWNEISGHDEPTIHRQMVAEESGTSLGNWKNISGLDSSMINSQIRPDKNGTRSSEDYWSTNASNSVLRESDDNCVNWQTSRGPNEFGCENRETARGPPGFPEIPQYSTDGFCPCGNAGCYYFPVPLSVAAAAINWTTNYTKPPSPLRHLYYDYPEFMSPPIEASIGIHRSPYVLIPFPANLVAPKLV